MNDGPNYILMVLCAVAMVCLQPKLGVWLSLGLLILALIASGVVT